MAKRATQKQISFARNIIAGMGPSEALKESLYDTSKMAAPTISAMATQLLNTPVIEAAILKAQEETLRGGRLIRDDIVAELENIATANLGEFIKFTTEEVLDRRGRWREVLILETKDYEDLTPDQLACIQEISEGQNGKIRIKLKSSTDAIKELNKLHGWHAPPKAAVGQDGKDVPVAAALMVPIDEYEAVRKAMLDADDC